LGFFRKTEAKEGLGDLRTANVGGTNYDRIHGTRFSTLRIQFALLPRMGKGELRLLCVASTIVLEGVRVPLSEAHCKDEQLLFLVMDSAMASSMSYAPPSVLLTSPAAVPTTGSTRGVDRHCEWHKLWGHRCQHPGAGQRPGHRLHADGTGVGLLGIRECNVATILTCMTSSCLPPPTPRPSPQPSHR
jgi:hypothetical protein